MPGHIIDERTSAGWLSPPTEARVGAMTADGLDPFMLNADVEERRWWRPAHVLEDVRDQ